MAKKAKTQERQLRPATQLVHGGIAPLAVRRELRGDLPDAGLRLRQRRSRRRRASRARSPASSIRASPTRPSPCSRSACGSSKAPRRRARTASGMAAVTAVFLSWLKAGDHVVAAKALFGSCRYVVEDLLPRYGIASTLVDGTDLGAVEEGGDARRPRRSSWKARPTRRSKSIDIAAVAEIAHKAGARLIVDNVFATPLLQQPLDARRRHRRLFGDQAHRRPGPRASAASSSPTRSSSPTIVHTFLRQTGPSLSPFNAWVLLKGLETLQVRVERQTATAAKLADLIADHPQGDARPLSRAAPTIRRPSSPSGR